MTSEGKYRNRQLIPRWSVSRTSFNIRDTLDLHSLNEEVTDEPLLSKKRDTWYTEQSTFSGIDYLGTALVLHSVDDPAITKAAQRLRSLDLSDSQTSVLDAIQRGGTEATTDNNIDAVALVRQLRRRLRSNPHDAISWVDLAYLCELHGATRSAERHIRTAVELAPDNRLVLRSMARFYAHREDPETALYFLRKSGFLTRDPWLLATDLSVSEIFGTPSKNIRTARRLAESLDTSAFNKSELKGSLSTIEFQRGTTQKWGRRWLREALTDPNENTLAQAEHLVTTHGLGIDLGNKSAPLDYEARARRAYEAQSFDEAVSYSKKWAEYQPLSAGPLVSGSFVLLAMMDDPISAIDFIRGAARRSTYSDPMVANNLVCALASAGRVEEAQRELRRISGSSLREGEPVAFTATRGLVAFREGNLKAGVEAYEHAIAAFKSKNDYGRLASVLIFYGRELALYNDDKAGPVLERAAKIIKHHKLAHVQYSAVRLLKGIGRVESVLENVTDS